MAQIASDTRTQVEPTPSASAELLYPLIASRAQFFASAFSKLPWQTHSEEKLREAFEALFTSKLGLSLGHSDARQVSSEGLHLPEQNALCSVSFTSPLSLQCPEVASPPKEADFAKIESLLRSEEEKTCELLLQFRAPPPAKSEVISFERLLQNRMLACDQLYPAAPHLLRLGSFLLDINDFYFNRPELQPLLDKIRTEVASSGLLYHSDLKTSLKNEHVPWDVLMTTCWSWVEDHAALAADIHESKQRVELIESFFCKLAGIFQLKDPEIHAKAMTRSLVNRPFILFAEENSPSGEATENFRKFYYNLTAESAISLPIRLCGPLFQPPSTSPYKFLVAGAGITANDLQNLLQAKEIIGKQLQGAPHVCVYHPECLSDLTDMIPPTILESKCILRVSPRFEDSSVKVEAFKNFGDLALQYFNYKSGGFGQVSNQEFSLWKIRSGTELPPQRRIVPADFFNINSQAWRSTLEWELNLLGVAPDGIDYVFPNGPVSYERATWDSPVFGAGTFELHPNLNSYFESLKTNYRNCAKVFVHKLGYLNESLDLSRFPEMPQIILSLDGTLPAQPGYEVFSIIKAQAQPGIFEHAEMRVFFRQQALKPCALLSRDQELFFKLLTKVEEAATRLDTGDAANKSKNAKEFVECLAHFQTRLSDLKGLAPETYRLTLTHEGQRLRNLFESGAVHSVFSALAGSNESEGAAQSYLTIDSMLEEMGLNPEGAIYDRLVLLSELVKDLDARAGPASTRTTRAFSWKIVEHLRERPMQNLQLELSHFIASDTSKEAQGLQAAWLKHARRCRVVV